MTEQPFRPTGIPTGRLPQLTCRLYSSHFVLKQWLRCGMLRSPKSSVTAHVTIAPQSLDKSYKEPVGVLSKEWLRLPEDAAAIALSSDHVLREGCPHSVLRRFGDRFRHARERLSGKTSQKLHTHTLVGAGPKPVGPDKMNKLRGLADAVRITVFRRP